MFAGVTVGLGEGAVPVGVGELLAVGNGVDVAVAKGVSVGTRVAPLRCRARSITGPSAFNWGGS